jgi:Ca2+-binding RTX toxin-like protein
LSLATDSGDLDTDRITRFGLVNVAGLEPGLAWQYSLDAGVTWIAGSGTTVALTGDGAKSLLVRQTDLAGNIVVTSPFVFTLDSTAPALPTIALVGATGAGGAVSSVDLADGVTLSLAGLDPTASGLLWLRKIDNVTAEASSTQVQTLTGATAAVDLTPLFAAHGPGIYQAEIRQTDVAGNASSRLSLMVLADNLASNGTFIFADGAYVGSASDDLAAGNPAEDELILAGSGNDVFFGLASGDVFVGEGGEDVVYVDQRTIEVTDPVGGKTHFAIAFYPSDVLLGLDVAAAQIMPLLSLGGNQAFAQAETLVIYGPDGALLHRLSVVIGTDGLPLLMLDDAANRVVLGVGSDRVDGGAGNDLLLGLAGDDWLSGGAGDDILVAGLSSAERVFGSSGTSTLSGGAGNDTLVALSGTVIARGDAGNDIFAVGGGAYDLTFLIEGFVRGVDKLDLGAYFAANGGPPANMSQWLLDRVQPDGQGNLLLSLASDVVIELANISALSIDDVFWSDPLPWIATVGVFA